MPESIVKETLVDLADHMGFQNATLDDLLGQWIDWVVEFELHGNENTLASGVTAGVKVVGRLAGYVQQTGSQATEFYFVGIPHVLKVFPRNKISVRAVFR